MTLAEEFRYGFLLRCADEGLDVAQAERRAATILKQAGWAGTLATAPVALGALGLGATGLVGYQAGQALGSIDNDRTAQDAIVAQEKVDVYRRWAEKLKRDQQLAGMHRKVV